MRLYLASTSPARLATLRAVGVEPVAIAPGVDEEAAVAAAGPLTAPEMVQLLARLKAEAVLSPEIDGLVLGGDSAFEIDGVIHGKPHRADVARERWHAQRGRSGRLHSGHWLIDHRGGRMRGAAGEASVATVHFVDDLDDAEIDAYIATGEPLSVAGAFTIDGLAGPFISRIEGDPHTVIGLSTPVLRRLVRGFGVDWPALWNRAR